jgi:hypothetical protein
MTTRRAVGALLVLLLLSAPVSAQDVVSISGAVTMRADGAPVPGARTFPGHSPFGMNGRALYARVGRTF